MFVFDVNFYDSPGRSGWLVTEVVSEHSQCQAGPSDRRSVQACSELQVSALAQNRNKANVQFSSVEHYNFGGTSSD